MRYFGALPDQGTLNHDEGCVVPSVVQPTKPQTMRIQQEQGSGPQKKSGGESRSQYEILYLNCSCESCLKPFLHFGHFPLLVEPVCFSNEKAARRVSFGAGYQADVHTDIPGGRPGAKTSVRPSKSGKKEACRVGRP